MSKVFDINQDAPDRLPCPVQDCHSTMHRIAEMCGVHWGKLRESEREDVQNMARGPDRDKFVAELAKEVFKR